ncbi:hypothetical protein BD309DRAFT_867547 [Dichomitus squalens]|nr:hypothetical protein BD309DRAFT_867547 [Dichomitus squalens]
MRAPSSALLDHPRSLDARTTVTLRAEATNTRMIYSGRWIINETGAHPSYRIGDSEAASITFYFSGSSLSVFTIGLLDEEPSENTAHFHATYMVDGREDLCTPSQRSSHAASPVIALVDCHAPPSAGRHVFLLSARSPSFSFSHIEIYLAPSPAPTLPPSPNQQMDPRPVLRHYLDGPSRVVHRRDGDSPVSQSSPTGEPTAFSPTGQLMPPCPFTPDCDIPGPSCINPGLPSSCSFPFPPSGISLPTASYNSNGVTTETATATVSSMTNTFPVPSAVSMPPEPSWPMPYPPYPPQSWPEAPSATSSQASSSSIGDMSISRGLTPGGIAGIVVGSVGGVLLLTLFVWLLRRGTFGSGTLFGFRYGDARYPGWKAGVTGTEMRKRDVEGYVTDPVSSSEGSTLAAPFVSATKPPPYSQDSFQASSASSLRKPPPLPAFSPTPPWSTSSSAFDHVYAVSSVSGASCSHTQTYSVSMSVSDMSTLVSEPVQSRPRSSTTYTNTSRLSVGPAYAYRPVPIPERVRSPPSTVSTSMVSFDRSDLDGPAPDVAPSETGSAEPEPETETEGESHWELMTVESEVPFAHARRASGTGRLGEGGPPLDSSQPPTVMPAYYRVFVIDSLVGKRGSSESEWTTMRCASSEDGKLARVRAVSASLDPWLSASAGAR